MTILDCKLRSQLDDVCQTARELAEAAARSALQKRAVDAAEPFSHFGPKEKELRNRLRARGRQVGDIRNADKTQTLDRLGRELAYEFWHRMLFARFLAENNLLMHPDGVAVSLEDCEALAKDATPPAPNGFVLAARYASTMLPQIFRSDDVLLEIDFAPEQRLAMERLLASLPRQTFEAEDSLGWVYQFWQTKRKAQVNANGNKIGADELPSVTQLFTENYMVDFLLDNTLGAWHAGKVLAGNSKLAENAEDEGELRKAATLPGCPWKYLRFIKGENGKWTPAAGAFDGWPKSAKELKCLDPCIGSGHFIVAMFERLVALRMAEEELDEAAAVAAVIRDNLFGLELDPRCTQIGAFNLALAAWRRVGHRLLPSMNLACSGLAPNTREADWLAIACDNEKLQRGMERLYRLFQKAAVLGSLINPRVGEGDLLVAAFHELQPLLEKALAQETRDEAAHEMAVTAHGLAKAAEILAGQFTLVATNVPYLTRQSQYDTLRDYCEEVFPTSKADLATCFIERGTAFLAKHGTISVVAPTNWLYQPAYKHFRRSTLEKKDWHAVARLGPGAFDGISGEVVNVTLVVIGNNEHNRKNRNSFSIDATGGMSASGKSEIIAGASLAPFDQVEQLLNPDARIVLGELDHRPLLAAKARSLTGLRTADNPQFMFGFWEVPSLGDVWVSFQSTVADTELYGGREHILRWDGGDGTLGVFAELGLASIQGRDAWNKRGVTVSLMGDLPVTLYSGDKYDMNCGAIWPHAQSDLAAVWTYCSSKEFAKEVRKIDQQLKLTTATLLKIPFDLAHWQKVALEKYPNGLPKPFSSDPTQWLFSGQPKGSDQPLHVAVSRLLGYQWPRQTGSSFPDCPALGPDGLEEMAHNDGIVCLPAVRANSPAADRLHEVLRKAYGKDWSESLLHKLLTDVGCEAGTTLDDWLRSQFFEQHFKLFHHCPFIWHIWDGRKDGFSALVNYHKFDNKALENLTYAYLTDWITAQGRSDKVGADLRLAAAQALQEKLKLILVGEPPYDIFVRWKPLHEQAIGWQPDLNDGVRMNIRPFIEADILRKTPNIKWTKNRGNEPERDKDDYPWFWRNNEFIGDRVNDVHLTNADKQAARDRKKGSK